MTIIKQPNIAFVDVETTKLDARTGHLLEIAVIVTDSDLNPLDGGEYHAVIAYSTDEVANMVSNEANQFVFDMHEKTGLWEMLSDDNAVPLNVVDWELRKFLRQFGEAKTMPVAGNSVRLDMNFMDEHLPLTAAYLDYHMRDVSTVAGLASDWYDLPWFEKKSNHTASLDVRESIRELKHYREAVFKTPFGKMPQRERDEVTADVMKFLISRGYTITAPGAVSETKEEA